MAICFIQSAFDHVSAHAVFEGSAHNFSCINIQDSAQVPLALLGRYVSYVRDTHLIWPLRCNVLHEIIWGIFEAVV